MDLNSEYSAHQHALIQADRAKNDPDRLLHIAQATVIGGRIQTFQLGLGAAAACAWSAAQLGAPAIV